MRYLHPVQAHERFLASGCYRFVKDGQALGKTESWAWHAHADGERFVRVDMDARAEEGKSILLEALQSAAGELVRFDIRYENDGFAGGIKTLRATYQLTGRQLQVGFSMNGAERQYIEVEVPEGTLIDIPLLVFRGRTIETLAETGRSGLPLFVPMYEHAQLFPGSLQTIQSPVVNAGEEVVQMGGREIATRRYRYRDKAAAYWIDRHGVVVKRVNAFNQQEIVVQISNYAAPSANVRSPMG